MNRTAHQILVLLRTETKLVGRNATVAGTATLFPIGMAVFLVWSGRGTLGALGWAFPVALALAVMCGMTVYITTTLTLTARREDLYLKRLRTSECSDATILTGLSSPPFLLGFVQCLLVVAIVWVGGPAAPTNLPLLLVGVVLTVALCTLLAIATTGLVSTTQQADMAAMPFFLFLLGTAVWAGTNGAVGPDTVQLLLPGGALVEIARLAYHPDLGFAAQFTDALPALGVLTAWTLLAAASARRLFRWDRRV